MRKLKLLMVSLILTLGGVLSSWAQTDVTSTYLVNPSFEILKATDGTTDVTVKTTLESGLYGWEVPTMSNYQVESEASGSSSGFVNGGVIVPTDGKYYYFNRQGWSNKDSELKTTTKEAVAPGNYYFVFDYKAADYSNENKTSKNGTTIGITVKDASSNTLATLQAAKVAFSIANNGSNPGSNAYMKDAPWSKKGIAFTVTSSSVLTFAVQQNMRNNGRSDIVYDNFKLYKIDGASFVDFTGYIANPGFEAENTNGWTGTNDGGDPAFSNGNKQQWNGSFSFSQGLSGLPNGKYKLTVQGFYRPGGNGADLNAQNALLFAGDATTPLMYETADAKAEKDEANGFTTAYGNLGYVPNNQTQVKLAFATGAYNGNELPFYVTNHTITIGTKKDVKLDNDWTVWDNFKLYLQALAVENYAEAYVASVTADKWYVYDVSANGDYRIISDVANTITYTQSGSDIDEDVINSKSLTAGTNEVVALTAGKLYYKVSTNATLTIEPNTYVYSVGDGTTSVANNAYTQSKTMTVTFAATTNDPSGAALSILDASKIKVNGAEASASITGNVLTITLADDLSTSTDYAVSIANGAVGYNADNTNAEISLTAKTPALFDGIFYIKQNDANKYISRGGDSNTEAVLDEYGIAAKFTTDENNVTHIQFVDNDKNLFGGSQTIYTDKNEADLGGDAARARWTITKDGNNYIFYSINWEKYIAPGNGQESGKYAATYSDTSYGWTLEAPVDHPAYASFIEANANAVANDADISVETLQGLKDNSDYMAAEVASDFTETSEKFQAGGVENQTKYDVNVFSKSYSDLSDGIYKITLSAFHRLTNNENTYKYSKVNADGSTVYLSANNYQVPLPSIMSEPNSEEYSSQNYKAEEGKNYPNGKVSAGEAFTAGRYQVELYAYVTDGKLDVALVAPAYCVNSNWICYRDLKITYYMPLSGVKAELQGLIEEAQSLSTNEYKTNGRDDLSTAIGTAQSALSSTTSEAFSQAIQALKDAMLIFRKANLIAFTGSYYVQQNAENGKFMAAGHNYGTRGMVNETGLDLNLTKDDDNQVSFNTQIFNGDNKHFLGSNLYMDSEECKWYIEQIGENTYSISYGDGTQFIGVDDDDNLAFSEEPTAWKFLDAKTVDSERLTANLQTLQTATASNGVDATFLLKDANFNQRDHRWSAWKVENCSNSNLGGGADWTNFNACAESFHSTFTISQTVTDAPAGVYELTAQGFYRQDKNGEEEITEPAPKFFANSQTAEVLARNGDEDNMTKAGVSFSTDDKYTISPLKFVVGLDGKLTVGIKNETAKFQWIIFDNFQLKYYGQSQLDYSELETACNNVDIPTLGFEKDEYAPYINVSNLEAIAAAKNLLTNKSAVYANDITAAKNSITGLTWTANTEEMDAVYNGDFSIGGWDITGWTRTNPWGAPLPLWGSHTKEELKAAGATNGTVYYNQPGSMQYGNAGVYTMPLKEKTIYELTFKYASESKESNKGFTVSVLNGEDGMAAIPYESNPKEFWLEGAFVTKTIKFVTGAAGNYVLTLANSGNTVMTDVSIKKATSQVLEFADGAEMPKYAPGTYPSVKISRTMEADRWYTAVYPFAVSGVDKIAVLDSYNDGVLGFTTENVTTSEANEPFLMRSNSKKTEIELSNVAVAAAAAAPEVTVGDVLSLKGVYTTTEVKAAEDVTNYVLSDNKIYKVGEYSATVNPYHAYIQLAQSAGESRELTFTVDGEATGISEVKAQNNAADGNIYNLNGQRVKNAKKGVYIMNGKTVIVK